jgi:hypothetical protein
MLNRQSNWMVVYAAQGAVDIVRTNTALSEVPAEGHLVGFWHILLIDLYWCGHPPIGGQAFDCTLRS